jgi:hypothetical protein
VVTGALWARSNLLSVIRWISAFIAPALTMLTTAFPSICCTRLVVPVRGSPVTQLIFLHPSRCSSLLMISFILAHFALSLRSEAMSYLLLRCTQCRWPGLDSCSFSNFRQAVAPFAHSEIVNFFGFLIPACADALSTCFPFWGFPNLCHATMFTYARLLMLIPCTCGLKGKKGFVIFLHLRSPPHWILLFCTSIRSHSSCCPGFPCLCRV